MSTEKPRDVAAFPITGRQAVRLVVGILWLGIAQLWFGFSLGTAAPGFTLLSSAVGFAIIVGAVFVRGEEAEMRFDLALLCGSFLFLLTDAHSIIGARFPSDEVAFVQQGTGWLLQGHDPFGANYAITFKTFGVLFGTPTLAGKTVYQVAYPAGSFLLLAPFVALLGVHSYAYLGATFVGLLAAVAILTRRLPTRFWGLLALLLLLPPVGDLLLSVLDFLYLPFVLLAFLGVERFQAPEAGRAWRWLSPVFLGIACSVKQDPWFLVPFLVIMVAMTARERRGRPWPAALRYVVLVGVTFLVINLPFIVWNPGAWLTSTLHPLTTPAVPWGIGVGTLLLVFGTGAYSLFSVAGLMAYASGLAFYIRFYARLKPAAPLLAVMPFLLTNRNPGVYFYMAPVVFVYLCVVLHVPSAGLVTARRTLIAVGAAAGCAALIAAGAGLAIRSPLSAQVASATATERYFTATVEVVNHGSSALEPHFIVTEGIIPDEPATVLEGPALVMPGREATYVVRTPEILGLPAPHGTTAFEIDVTTTSPDTFAVSSVGTCAC
jgi:hypothetical protein